MVVNDLRNTLLIGLTVTLLASAAWWLNPDASRAQLAQDGPAADKVPASQDAPGDTSSAEKPAVKPKPPSLHHVLGIDTARARLGKAIPTGKGIAVGHVEIGQGAYLPNTQSPKFRGVTFVKRSGPAKVSGHAFSTARVIYGLAGLAPGVNVVHCFESRHWMSDGYLNGGTTEPPSGGPMRVLTHSWVSDAPNAVDILRRVDWQIDRHDTIICVGVNNGRETPVPYLLGTAHNVIAVGTAQPGAGSSGGYTRIETRGRCKPDIVGPRGLTSYTTPAVAACAARLLQAADEMTDHAHLAGKAETIKAVLLCGAVKPRSWKPKPGHPLDERLGAGVVHFDQSLQVLQSGPVPQASKIDTDSTDASLVPASAPVRLPNRMGWDFREIQPDQTLGYTFQTQAPMGEASVVLAWNRRISSVNANAEGAERSNWYGSPRTADLNLRLFHTDDAGDEHEIAVSESRVDNVEHIYIKNLDAGRYRLEVSRVDHVYDEPWAFALAWRVALLEAEAE